jgi:hypothetical protein
MVIVKNAWKVGRPPRRRHLRSYVAKFAEHSLLQVVAHESGRERLHDAVEVGAGRAQPDGIRGDPPPARIVGTWSM